MRKTLQQKGFLKILALLFLFTVTPALAGYSTAYLPSKSPSDLNIALQLRNSEILEHVAFLLNHSVAVPQEITIVAKSCGTSNAFYSPKKKEITLCYELVTKNANKLSNKFGRQNSQQQLADILVAELIFILLHEAGHSLVDVHNLPVLGREEDAADKISTFILLGLNKNQWLKDSTLYFQMNKPNLLDSLLNRSAIYGDEHSLNQQRIGNVVCWGYGKNPSDFSALAASVKLPESRLMRCKDEYNKLDRDIRTLLGSNLTIDRLAAQMPPIPLVAAPIFLKLEPFTVNLTADDAEHFLQTEIELKVADHKVTDLIKANIPNIRNNVLLLLSSKTARTLSSIEGKQKLGDEIKKLLNKILNGREDGGVSEVLFTSFVIQ